ncbi:MAG TPA: hypothetical protein VFD92_19940 [Candidatus Binatia bacterium]|nr:hypothetical protein [Candidatus Binatia bacterium]
MLRKVKERVLADRCRHALSMEVEKCRLDEATHCLARAFGLLAQSLTGESGLSHPLVSVEVKQSRLCLGDPSEGIRIHPHKLEQRVLGKALLECGLPPAEDLDVLFHNSLSQPRRSAHVVEPPRRRELERNLRGRLVDRVRSLGPGREELLEIVIEKARLGGFCANNGVQVHAAS